jgi:hypothetical protein
MMKILDGLKRIFWNSLFDMVETDSKGISRPKVHLAPASLALLAVFFPTRKERGQFMHDYVTRNTDNNSLYLAVWSNLLGEDPKRVSPLKKVGVAILNIPRFVFDYLPRTLSYATQKLTSQLFHYMDRKFNEKTVKGVGVSIALSVLVTPVVLSVNIATRILSRVTQTIFSPKETAKNTFLNIKSFLGIKTSELESKNKHEGKSNIFSEYYASEVSLEDDDSDRLSSEFIFQNSENIDRESIAVENTEGESLLPQKNDSSPTTVATVYSQLGLANADSTPDFDSLDKNYTKKSASPITVATEITFSTSEIDTKIVAGNSEEQPIRRTELK